MMENGIVMEDVYLAISNYDNEKLQFIYSDDNSKNLIGRISIKADIQGNEDDILNGLSDQSDVISIFKNIQEDILNNVVIKGIKGITNIVMSEKSTYVKENDEIVQKKPWILETDGVNLLNVFNSEFVDFANTYSNDILEIYIILVLKQQVNILLEEITSVMSDASYINNRHIELLCDVMTNKKDICPQLIVKVLIEVIQVHLLNVHLKIQLISLLKQVSLEKKINLMVFQVIL